MLNCIPGFEIKREFYYSAAIKRSKIKWLCDLSLNNKIARFKIELFTLCDLIKSLEERKLIFQ